jgi:hypothetical protein
MIESLVYNTDYVNGANTDNNSMHSHQVFDNQRMY